MHIRRAVAKQTITAIKPWQSLTSDCPSFERLTNFADDLALWGVDEEAVALPPIRWMNAELCAPLGAILAQYGISRIGQCDVDAMDPQVVSFWGHNGFLHPQPDRAVPRTTGDTVLNYECFAADEQDRHFQYVREYFTVERFGETAVSEALLAGCQRALRELFDNSREHAESRHGIFTCGQEYPSRDAVHYCVADAGIGIPERMRGRFGDEIDDIEAVSQAMDGATTRTGDVPGGSGLNTIIRPFIQRNGGSLIAVSGHAYWCQEGGTVRTGRLRYPFPGTAVVLIVKTGW